MSKADKHRERSQRRLVLKRNPPPPIPDPILSPADLAKMVRTLAKICEWEDWAGPGSATDTLRKQLEECERNWPDVNRMTLIDLKRQYWGLLDQLQEGQ